MALISIAIVDDQPLMVDAIRTILSKKSSYEVVACGKCANDIVDIGVAKSPNVLIVDVNLNGDVYAAIVTATRLAPASKIVVFTAATGVEFAIRALDAGASAFVSKQGDPRELIRAVDCVMAGETYITQNFASKVITALRDTSLRRKAAEIVRFSIREDQIIRALMRGGTNKQIATTLKISEKTVKHYMTIVMQKLNARNRVEVVIAAQKLDGYDNHVMHS